MDSEMSNMVKILQEFLQVQTKNTEEKLDLRVIRANTSTGVFERKKDKCDICLL